MLATKINRKNSFPSAISSIITAISLVAAMLVATPGIAHAQSTLCSSGCDVGEVPGQVTAHYSNDTITVSGKGTLSKYKWQNIFSRIYKSDFEQKWDSYLFITFSDAPGNQISFPKDSSNLFSILSKPSNNIEIVISKNVYTSNVTNMDSMFAHVQSVTGDTSGWDTSKVTNMESMFIHAGGNIDTSNWDVSSVTNFSHMFSNSGMNPNVSNWNTASAKNMSHMFLYASPKSLDVSKWNTSNVTDMSAMFFYASPKSLDVSKWNTSNVTDMSRMFNNYYGNNPDVANWDTSNVQDMNGMFAFFPGTSNSIHLDPDVSKWNVTNVTNMDAMFSNNPGADPDISQWVYPNLKTVNGMFCGATKATKWKETSLGKQITACDKSNVSYTKPSGNNSGLCMSFSDWALEPKVEVKDPNWLSPNEKYDIRDRLQYYFPTDYVSEIFISDWGEVRIFLNGPDCHGNSIIILKPQQLITSNNNINAGQYPGYQVKIASIGDSYTAGNGAGYYERSSVTIDSERRETRRSAFSYGRLYSQYLRDEGIKARFTNHAVSGAVTKDIKDQVVDLDSDTDVVLMTAGGNDANFESIASNCLTLKASSSECYKALAYANDHLDTIIENTEQIFKDIEATTKDATIVLVGYPYLAPDIQNTLEIDEWISPPGASILNTVYHNVFYDNSPICTFNEVRQHKESCRYVRDGNMAVRNLQALATLKQSYLVEEWNNNPAHKTKAIYVPTTTAFRGHEPNNGTIDKAANVNRNSKRWINEVNENLGIPKKIKDALNRGEKKSFRSYYAFFDHYFDHNDTIDNISDTEYWKIYSDQSCWGLTTDVSCSAIPKTYRPGSFSLLTPDQYHPNIAGHIAIANLIKEKLPYYKAVPELAMATNSNLAQSTISNTGNSNEIKTEAWIQGPIIGFTNEAVEFDARSSTVKQGEIVQYDWDYDNDGSYDETTTSGLAAHVYQQPYNGKAKVTITTSDGSTATNDVDVSIEGDNETIPKSITRAITTGAYEENAKYEAEIYGRVLPELRTKITDSIQEKYEGENEKKPADNGSSFGPLQWVLLLVSILAVIGIGGAAMLQQVPRQP